MTALLGYLWTFLNSSAGQTVILLVLGKIFHSAVKDKGRREKLLEYASQAFLVAEAVGVAEKLGGRAKYLRFVETIVNKLKAAKEPELSAKEMQLLSVLAAEKSWIAKAPAR